MLPDVNQDYAEQHQGLYSFYLPIKLERTGPTDALGQQMVQGTCRSLLACFFLITITNARVMLVHMDGFGKLSHIHT